MARRMSVSARPSLASVTTDRPESRPAICLREGSHLADNKQTAVFQPFCDPKQVPGMQADTALGGIPGATPAVNKDCRSTPFDRVRPVPIGQYDKVIKRVGAAKPFMAEGVWRPHHHVVVGVLYIIRPQITRPDGHRPACRFRHPVGPVEHPSDVVHPFRRCTIALGLARRDAAAPQGAGKNPPGKAQPAAADHHVQRCHRRCPDLRALTSR